MKESILWPILQQARSHATNGFNFDVDKFHNKFAELIVIECVTKMALEIMDEQWVDEAVKNTYTHYGVEE